MRSVFALQPPSLHHAWSKQALALHRVIFRFALGGTHVFAWVFAFEYFRLIELNISDAFVRIVLLYTLTQVLVSLLTPFSARLLQYGARKALIYGTSFAIIGFMILNAAFEGVWTGAAAASAIAAFAVCMGIYRSIYWVPYEVESEAHRTRGTSVAGQLLVALAPLLGGLIIVLSNQGPSMLLYAGVLCMALSLAPLLFVRDIHEKFSWRYRETFTHLFDLETYPILREAFFDGIVGAALLFFWPLAIFMTIGRQYDTLGVVLSLSLIVTVLLRGFVRRYLARKRLADAPLLNTVFAITPWIFRLAVASPLGLVLVDSYFYTTAKRTMGSDPYVLEQSADGGTYVDEYTALKEISLAGGRITLCLIAAVSVWLGSVPIALILVMLAAALASTVTFLWSRAK